ncbi:hypothetical protein PoB_003830500 [Plakobranchus ocellatus]|uniref:Uncharacterized protein n=1 Tax=Plakobranchus ocellatus TaxID=259542 RepID=A0AAV4ATY0_9GAST|nr:hypothetical protein PoB_003830500 [Plakobranchus ocellatus]
MQPMTKATTPVYVLTPDTSSTTGSAYASRGGLKINVHIQRWSARNRDLRLQEQIGDEHGTWTLTGTLCYWNNDGDESKNDTITEREFQERWTRQATRPSPQTSITDSLHSQVREAVRNYPFLTKGAPEYLNQTYDKLNIPPSSEIILKCKNIIVSVQAHAASLKHSKSKCLLQNSNSYIPCCMSRPYTIQIVYSV